jgi:hypothetical protein
MSPGPSLRLNHRGHPINGIPRSDIHELDHRSGDGLGVALLWSAATDQLFVVVRDERGETSIEIEVDAAHARDAFLDPFAYADADEFAPVG